MRSKSVLAFFLWTMPALSAQSASIQIQVTGEHTAVAGDTNESSRQFALVAAYRQAVREIAGGLQSRLDLGALQLTRVELEAYLAALIDSDDATAAAASTAPTYRVTLRASLDTTGIVERLTNLHNDDDAARTLRASWTRSEQLRQRIDEQTGRRAGMNGADAAAVVADQINVTTSLNAQRIAARGTAALARTELSTIGGRTPSTEGRRRAKELANAALALAPDLAETRTLLGDLFVDAELPDAAEAEYRRALAANPASAAARTKLAEALRLQGKFTEAAAELREVIRTDPAFAQAHADLGMILRAEGQIAEALAEYREAVRLEPRSTEAHNGLAIALAGAGQQEEAVSEFRAIVALDPDSTIGYYNLATVLAALDRDVEAAAALREVIRIYPNHYNARYNLGELLRLEQKYDDSATQFREYLRLAPDTPQNRRNIERAKRFVQQFTSEQEP